MNKEKAARRPVEGIYSTREVAELLGKTPATIRRYAQRGVLARVYANSTRAIGFTAASVRALLEGGAQ